MPASRKEYPLAQVIELACAAQRANNSYIKIIEATFSLDDPNKVMYYKHPNKTLMLVAIGEDNSNYTNSGITKPELITTNLDDQALSNEIQKFYRRLAFTAIEGENEFLTKVNQLLNSETVSASDFGWIACLPSVFKRDYARNRVKKIMQEIDPGILANPNETVLDKDCEIIKCERSKNYDAWNVDAIIDNKLVSWMSKNEMTIGPCVLVKGKVKTVGKHWQHPTINVTRLNYVKAAQ